MKSKRKASKQEAPTPTPTPTPTKTPFNWDLLLKVLATVLSAATLGFGIYQFVVKPRLDTDAEARRAKQETNTEFRKQKQDLYTQAMDSAANFANASTQAAADAAKDQFFKLHDGKLSAVESPEVKLAMQIFGGGIRAWEGFNDPTDFTPPGEYEVTPPGEEKAVSLRQLSYRLTQACRKDLGN